MRLSERLQGAIPETLLPLLPDRFEVFGDIAVINLPDPLLPFQKEIGEAIIKDRRNISTIMRRISTRQGSGRIARYEHVIGSKTETICRELGFLYKIDLADAFFTTRLVGEHDRIARLIQPEELIFVPFAGVGPFVIPIAARKARVIAMDMNRKACRLLSENLRLNKLQGSSAVIRGDATTADSMLRCSFDRAIIPNPLWPWAYL